MICGKQYYLAVWEVEMLNPVGDFLRDTMNKFLMDIESYIDKGLSCTVSGLHGDDKVQSNTY